MINEIPAEGASADAATPVRAWIERNGARIRRATLWAQIATGMFLMGLGYRIGNVQFDLIREGVRTSGRIVRFEYVTYSTTGARGARSSTSAFHPIVEFEVDGRRVRFRDRIGSASGGLNDVVPVLFSAERPSMAMIERPFWNWIPWAPTFIVGAFLLLVGAIGKLKDRGGS
jgi:hypothetical protein